MSVKIVTSTLKYIEQSHYVNIDDAGEQPGRIIGPEESYLNKEREEPDVKKDSETGKTTEENFDIEDNEESSIEDELDVLEDELPLL